MQYGYIDDARRAYITPQPDTPHPWVIGRNPLPNLVDGPGIVKILQILMTESLLSKVYTL